MDKGIIKAIKILRHAGWTVELEKGKHWKAKLAFGDYRAPSIYISDTPSDRNAVRNVINDFKKAVKGGGFDFYELNRAY